MKHPFITLALPCVAIVAAFFIGSTYYHHSPFYTKIHKAIAVIHPTKNSNAKGIMTFVAEKDGVHINAQVSGLTPGNHGFHIHEFGDCSADDAMSAGAHYNPTHKHHGAPTNHDHHVGDLGNMVADAQGNAVYQSIAPTMQLNGPLSIIGRAIIVHEKEDDLYSQPTGNAGGRVACGVIGIAKK